MPLPTGPTVPIKFQKAIASLPATLTPNSFYAVRVGDGFELYVSDMTGTIAYRSNATVGPKGDTGQGFSFLGPWDNTYDNYHSYDVVTYNGELYLCVNAPDARQNPATSYYWTKIVERGPQGPQGEIGPQGPTGPASTVPGPKGDTGPAGAGLAPGGSAGYVLVKNSSADYDTSWQATSNLAAIKTFNILGTAVGPLTGTAIFRPFANLSVSRVELSSSTMVSTIPVILVLYQNDAITGTFYINPGQYTASYTGLSIQITSGSAVRVDLISGSVTNFTMALY